MWVIYGQSNMAFPLGQVLRNDTESLQANLPNLRPFSITTNEQADLPDDIDRTTIGTGGWVTSSPETALAFSAIGYVFGCFNIKGVLLHHGHNNAMTGNCRPTFYRWMTKALIAGVREDFKDPAVASGVIGFCAGARPQSEEDFETQPPGPAFIREAQRLGVADLNDLTKSGSIPAYDVQVAGLHPGKKVEHGQRAARWALNTIDDRKAQWQEAKLLSMTTEGDEMMLTFDVRVHRDDSGTILEGFALAGEDDKCYRTHAPMGNLKVQGHQGMPLPEFRTDSWDLPESDDLTDKGLTKEFSRQWEADGKARLQYRRTEEAKRAIDIMERLETLGKPKP